MARPTKFRRICRMPCCQSFYPEHSSKKLEILLSIEEYECIRLMDYLGYTQQQAAAQMGASRTTIQALYTEGRKKMARFLVEGTPLKIQGGNYQLCGHSSFCSHKKTIKGEHKMKIAVTYENGQVFQHFGHTEQFKVYQVEDGKVVSSEVIGTNGQGHGALADFLFNGGISVLICGGIGGGARNALAEAGVELYPGASGNADAQVESFLKGNLSYDPDTMCSHHGEGHTCGSHQHEEDHSCGSHGCHS